VECFSETAITGCSRSYYGYEFWTAGQRIDLANSGSQFVWRVTSTDTYSNTVYAMTYTNWYGDSGSCTALGISSYYSYSYKWQPDDCDEAKCSVCEIDV